MINVLSPARIEDAAGTFGDTVAAVTGINPEFNATEIPRPAFADVAQQYAVDERVKSFTVSRTNAASLQAHPGLRILAGIQLPTHAGGVREVFVPGIVLAGDQPRLGCLMAYPDFIADTDAAEKGSIVLSDLQHRLLDHVYALHDEGVGAHGRAGMNPADAAHGNLIVVTQSGQIQGIHDRVHAFTAQGLGKSIAASGALDVPVNERMRPVRPDVIPAAAATRIVVVREHQLPPKQEFAIPTGQLAVGLTLSTVRAKRNMGFSQPNMAQNLNAMLET